MQNIRIANFFILSVKKSIKSVSFLWVSALLGSGSTFLINTIIARQLGTENFGVFSSVMATVLIFSILGVFGLNQVWLKIFGEEGYDGIRWVKPSLKFIALNLSFTIFILIAWASFGPHNTQIKQMLLFMIFHILGYVSIQLVASRFQLEEKFKYLAIWQLLPNVTRLLTVLVLFYVLHFALSILDVSIVYAVVGLFFFLLGSYFLFTMNQGKINLAGHQKKTDTKVLESPKVSSLFYEAAPFGIGNLFAFIYVQSDIIMLKYLTSDEQAGLYSAAFLILSAIYLFPSILYGKFLMPKFHRWANHDRKKFYAIYKKGNFYMFLVGVFITTVIILLSAYIIPLVFGADFISSIPLLKILSFTIPFIFVGYSFAATLVTKDNMKKKVIFMGIVALVNIILNFSLIPIFDANGAAFATIFSNFILVIIYFWANKKYVFNDIDTILNE